MKIKAKCSVVGCGWETEKETRKSANWALTVHVARKHKNENRKILESFPPVNIQNNQPIKEKRSYNRKKSIDNKVHFCPVCGCHLQAVQVALNITSA